MIFFHYVSVPFKVKGSKKSKAWLEYVIKKEKKYSDQIHYYFVDEKKLLELNIRFLGHDTHTDILTFGYTEGKKLSAEIFICPALVKENSEKFGTTFKEELHRVMVHGILHLCGYKDKTKKEKQIMRNKENLYLKKFFKPSKS
ncbi:MAG: rRNA maturation RNase YbeY [Bacteroidia bacterium]|nr:rRNA maturation RNase YbeY [Bacteroidia bacterium]